MKMKILYSGFEFRAVPEVLAGDGANLMLTYWEVCKLPKRFKNLVKYRNKKRKKNAQDKA